LAQRRAVWLHPSVSTLVDRRVGGVPRRTRRRALREVPQIGFRPRICEAAFRTGQAIHLNTSRTAASPRRCAVTESTVFADSLSTACSSVSRGRMSCRCSQALKRA